MDKVNTTEFFVKTGRLTWRVEKTLEKQKMIVTELKKWEKIYVTKTFVFSVFCCLLTTHNIELVAHLLLYI